MTGFVLIGCLVLGTMVIVANAWNEEKPIYKWSPVWFNYNRDVDKRYNEDKPIYKWNPNWLGTGGFVGKRTSQSCLPELSVCGSRLRCCSPLQCTRTTTHSICLDTLSLGDPEFDKK